MHYLVIFIIPHVCFKLLLCPSTFSSISCISNPTGNPSIIPIKLVTSSKYYISKVSQVKIHKRDLT